jgi:hypothetical protein
MTNKKTIEKAFSTFLLDAYDAEPTPEQYDQLRDAFFGGALISFTELLLAAGRDAFSFDLICDEMRAELERYGKALAEKEKARK